MERQLRHVILKSGHRLQPLQNEAVPDGNPFSQRRQRQGNILDRSWAVYRQEM